MSDAPERWRPVPPSAPITPAPPAAEMPATPPPSWRPVPPRAAEARLVRPSLWAAFDVPFKALGTVAFFLLPFGVTGAVASGDPRILFLTLAQFLPAFLFTFAPGIRLAFTTYLVEEDGVRVRTQIFTKTESRVPWEKVTALRHRRTLIDRLFGIERLDIIAYGVRGTTLHLVGLRDAHVLRDQAARKMREHATAGSLLSSD